jgi:hypothetical protein
MHPVVSSASIRLSQNQVRSNPILASQQDYCRGGSLRDKELRQLARLQQFQSDGIPLFKRPEMHRIDSSSLRLSEKRIGVAGLVVDHRNVGFVTRLHVELSRTWDISANLPFRQIHIQNLLLSVLSGSGFEESLPELFAFKIRDSLADRYEGDSMDISGLLAILDASLGQSNSLLDAAVAVVSPITDDWLVPSKSVQWKLKAFHREFGEGSLLIRHTDDEEASAFDNKFKTVWQVRNLEELAENLRNAGLLQSLLSGFTLRSEHAYAIASQLGQWLDDESQFARAVSFLKRIKGRISNETPARIRLEVSFAEEDLCRHRGHFDAAIAVREQRLELIKQPFVSCYEREVDSDNRHAAALYDAHRFPIAIDCLQFWDDRIKQDPKICLPETRAKLLNTLARCLVITKDPRWEKAFELSLNIQAACDPSNLPITKNFLLHGYLKSDCLEKARALLESNAAGPNAFQIWLAAEYARRASELWNEEQCKAVTAIDPALHVRGFACQAIARQQGRSDNSRLEYFKYAQQAFSYGLDHDKTNIKQIMSLFCSLAIAVVSQDSQSLKCELARFHHLTTSGDFQGVKTWYENEINELEHLSDWNSIERLFLKVPHF